MQEKSSENSLKSYVRELWTGLFGDSGEGTRPAPPEPLRELDEILAKIKESSRKEGDSSSEEAVSSSPQENGAAEREYIYRRIKADIFSCHNTLKTGITAEDLPEMVRILSALGESGETNSSTCEQTLRKSVIEKLLAECGPIAWKSLCSAMERAGLTWPAPEGLPEWADAKSRNLAARRELRETEEAFLNSTPERIGDRMVGVVPVWKADYPDQDSALWRKLVLQGVGFGIFATLLLRAEKVLVQEGSFREQIRSLLNQHIADLDRSLKSGTISLEDADRLVHATSRLCSEIAPGLAWELAQPEV